MKIDQEKVKKTVQQLEVEKGVKARELEEVNRRLGELSPRVQSYFGTLDPEALSVKKAELEAKIEEDVKKLESLGVKFQ